MRKRTGGLIGAGAMALILLSGGAAGALSEPGPESDGTDPSTAFAEDVSAEDQLGFFDDWTPTAEELAEINAEIAKEFEALRAAGVVFTVETDEFGFEYPVWAVDQDEAAWSVLEELYGELMLEDGDFFDDAELFDDWTPTAEELAEINAEIAKEFEALRAAGVVFTVETDEFGFEYPVWAVDQDEAAWTVLDELYGEMILGEDGFFGALPGFDDDWTPTADEVAAANAYIAEELAALEAAGVVFTVETDEFGFEYPVWDPGQAEAVMDVYDELYGLIELGAADIFEMPPMPEELDPAA